MEKIAGHEVSKSLRVIIIFKPLKIPVISGHGHFRSFSNQHIDDDGSTEERGYGIERDNSTIRRQRAEQIAEQG